MGLLYEYPCVGIRCDARGCPASITGDGDMSSDHYRDVAISRGWTLWTGRSLRAYCPEHLPSPGHKMSQVSK